MKKVGLTSASDSGCFQRVPMFVPLPRSVDPSANAAGGPTAYHIEKAAYDSLLPIYQKHLAEGDTINQGGRGGGGGARGAGGR